MVDYSKTNQELQADAASLVTAVSSKIAKTDFIVVDSSIRWIAPDGSTYTWTVTKI